MRKTDGFTLIELMVAIVCSALVTGAVITFMLMGLDTNRSVMDANADQRNARIVISMMENLASEGSIQRVDYIGASGETNRDWALLDSDNAAILSYSGSSQSLRGRNGTVLMEGVLASSVKISDQTLNGCLLDFTLETNAATYNTSVFCRVSDIDTDGVVLDTSNSKPELIPDNNMKEESDNIFPNISYENINTDARLSFLQVLATQYNSTGTIIGTADNGKPYSLWYNGGTYLPGWDENTPWCACFLSWGLAQVESSLTNVPKYANVDELWAFFQEKNAAYQDDYRLIPGDLIFFDWDNNDSLDHVGAIFYNDQTKYVYTIEGNSGGRVALRRYEFTDPSIHGYGVLPWKTSS